jgi:hypothetical protein
MRALRLNNDVFNRAFTEERVSFPHEAYRIWQRLQAQQLQEHNPKPPKPEPSVDSKPLSWNPSFFLSKAKTPTKKSSSATPTPISTKDHTPCDKYKYYECELCEEIGHIKWSCPLYQCQHCYIEGPGHKPENCPCQDSKHPMRLRGGMPSPSQMTCLSCYQDGHIRQDCYHYQCRHCHRRAPHHLSKDCPRRPPRTRQRQAT